MLCMRKPSDPPSNLVPQTRKSLTEDADNDIQSGLRRATARQHLTDNPPMYRGHSQENHRLYYHLEKKIEAKFKILRLADKKSDELTTLQVSAGNQGSKQNVTGAEEKPTGVPVELLREHEPELQAWVKQAHEHPDLHAQMRQELEKETDQCLEDMAVLLRRHSKMPSPHPTQLGKMLTSLTGDVVECISRLQSHTRVDRIPWSKYAEALSSDIALDAPENDFLWYADDYVRLDDRHTFLGLDFVMYNQGFLAVSFRVKSLHQPRAISRGNSRAGCKREQPLETSTSFGVTFKANVSHRRRSAGGSSQSTWPAEATAPISTSTPHGGEGHGPPSSR